MKKLLLFPLISLLLSSCGVGNHTQQSCAHSWGDWSQVTAPTCIEKGQEKRVCSICSEIEYQDIDAFGHTKGKISSDVNYHWFECSVCGAKIDSESHTFEDTVVPASYEASGYTIRTCSICGYSYNCNETEQLTYTVTWKNWDDSILSKEQYKKGLIPSYKGTPLKEYDSDYAYVFSGWYPQIVQVDNDATYTAQFEQQTRTEFYISFNANGGTNAPNTISKHINVDCVIPSEVPVKSRYIFYGWNSYLSNEIYKPGDSLSFNKDVTLYAMWAEQCNVCSGKGIVHNSESCSTCNGKGTITNTSSISVPCSSCGGRGTITTSYQTACSSCGGFGGRVYCECSCGYKWYANDTGSRKCSQCGRTVTGQRLTTCSSCNGSGTTTVTNTSTCSTCNGKGTITYSSTTTTDCTDCGGKGTIETTNPCTNCDFEGFLLPAAPTLLSKSHESVVLQIVSGFEYSLDGINWQDSSAFDGLNHDTTYCFYQRKSSDSNSPFGITSKPLTVTTSSLPTYTINYILNGGTNDPSNPSTYTVEDSIIFATPTRTGYTFDGWYDDDNQTITGILIGSTGSITIEARWSANLNDLSVTSEDTSKGTVTITSGSGYSDETITVIATPIGDYAFKGWYHDSLRISRSSTYTFTMPTSNYSLTAHFYTKAEAAEEELIIKYAKQPILSDDGKTIAYGLYPQKNVNDSSLVSALDSLETPESNDWYLYNGDYYAKVSATPHKTAASLYFDNGTPISKGTTYWFKCEPILWNILSNNNGDFFIISSDLLDAHCYYNSMSTRTIDDKKIYPNNYEYSDIRTWLNNDFYCSAFALGDECIQTTLVDNSSSTLHSGSDTWVCNNTQDKVFLPSYQDYINSDYGFSPANTYDEAKYCKTTDWARARGAFYVTSNGNGNYWTRSPHYRYGGGVYIAINDGRLLDDDADKTSYCVRPCLFIRL